MGLRIERMTPPSYLALTEGGPPGPVDVDLTIRQFADREVRVPSQICSIVQPLTVCATFAHLQIRLKILMLTFI